MSLYRTSATRLVFGALTALLIGATACVDSVPPSLPHENPVKTAAYALEQSSDEAKLALEAIPDAEQTEGYFAGVVLSLSAVDHLLDHTIGIDWQTADIEMLIQLLLQLIAEDATDDLREMLEDMKDANAEKQALRDLMRKVKEDADALKKALRDEYNSREELEGYPETLEYGPASILSDFILPSVGEGQLAPTGSIGLSVDAPTGDARGAVVAASAQCASLDGAKTSPLMKAELIDLRTGAVVASHSGAGYFSLAYAAPEFALLRLNVSAGGASASCPLRLTYPHASRSAPVTLTDFQIRAAGSAFAKVRQAQLDFAKAVGAALLQGAGLDTTTRLRWASKLMARLNTVSALGLSFETTKSLTVETIERLDSISEMGQQDMLLLQRIMEQKSQLESVISNVMKAGYEAGQAAVQALKAS